MTRFLFILTFFCSLWAFSAPVQAELRIDLTRGVVEPLPIALSPFVAVEEGPAGLGLGQAKVLALDLPEVISANLQSSGLFKSIDPKAFIQNQESVHLEGPRFGEWRAIGTQALITGTVTDTVDGRTRVEFRLWDVFSEKQLTGTAYITTSDNWRRIAHIISDEIYTRLSGEDGYFDSRLVYIAESGPMQNRVKRLAIMDQDGANQKYLTDGQDLVLTPRFSPTEQKVAYMSYEGKGPAVYIYDLEMGRRQKLGDFPGMTFAPRFSPDGDKVIMSLSKNGNSDVYELDLKSKKTRRLTTSASIDTAPSYAPDGKRVVFESDRGGSQQLYVMNKNGSDVHRITFGQGRYGNPVWSPRGDLIAFTRIYKGQFYIGVIRPDGSGERLISNAYHVEGPSWSPNGRVLVYFKERPTGLHRDGREAKLYTIDITGYNERVLRTQTYASDPAWSPVNVK